MDDGDDESDIDAHNWADVIGDEATPVVDPENPDADLTFEINFSISGKPFLSNELAFSPNFSACLSL